MTIAAKYVYRWVPWNLIGGKLTLHRDGTLITLEPWYEQVFLEASGLQTVAQLIARFSSEYAGGPPAGLEAQVTAIVKDLAARSIVKLSDAPYALPPYLIRPLFDQPPAVYREQMIADGFIKR
jgi:hypothetical protein